MIETERLIFRRYTLNDFDLLFQMTSDAEVMKYIRHGRPWSREETSVSLTRYIEWNDQGTGLWLAYNKEEGKMIGHSGLIPQIVEGESEIEVGYWVVKDSWGKGYGLEQAKAWRDYGLNCLERTRLVSIIKHGNTGSRRVAEKNGMVHEKDCDYNNINVALYAINK